MKRIEHEDHATYGRVKDCPQCFTQPPSERTILLDLITELRGTESYQDDICGTGEIDDAVFRAEQRLREVTGDE